ncbi:GAF domain-containing protein [Pseudoalteromonas xiamenensis]|uniref:Histidine kinase n=1 Tax=Pseudoalteromonas xiamenensis TaxID=882626 RepID=A0A975DHV0_9GAMM|nr:GAF domain-containing protein [Pseudoalteromonas xiamenensis]QTH71970.1 histidine kinase [Pseudoalteromonas xiamenensis]
MISTYISNAKINIDVKSVELALDALNQFLAEPSNNQAPVWTYRIPELGEGGACSLFGALQDEPFSLESELPKDKDNNDALADLQKIVFFIEQKTNVDWFGIYQARSTSEGPQLLKLAYLGAPSRPLFPLTPEFAQISNNVQVGLSGKARIINDVATYVASGGEYYTCDPKVSAEVCLPLFNEEQQCIGIIDAEAFQTEFFTDAMMAFFVAVCIKIPHYLPR